MLKRQVRYSRRNKCVICWILSIVFEFDWDFVIVLQFLFHGFLFPWLFSKSVLIPFFVNFFLFFFVICALCCLFLLRAVVFWWLVLLKFACCFIGIWFWCLTVSWLFCCILEVYFLWLFSYRFFSLIVDFLGYFGLCFCCVFCYWRKLPFYGLWLFHISFSFLFSLIFLLFWFVLWATTNKYIISQHKHTIPFVCLYSLIKLITFVS